MLKRMLTGVLLIMVLCSAAGCGASGEKTPWIPEEAADSRVCVWSYMVFDGEMSSSNLTFYTPEQGAKNASYSANDSQLIVESAAGKASDGALKAADLPKAAKAVQNWMKDRQKDYAINFAAPEMADRMLSNFSGQILICSLKDGSIVNLENGTAYSHTLGLLQIAPTTASGESFLIVFAE